MTARSSTTTRSPGCRPAGSTLAIDGATGLAYIGTNTAGVIAVVEGIAPVC